MSKAAKDLEVLMQQALQAKARWREHAAKQTWEQKIAAIERMRGRDAVLRVEREKLRRAALSLQPVAQAPAAQEVCRFVPFPSRGGVVPNALINHLRDQEGAD